jgi:hypothetical protein
MLFVIHSATDQIIKEFDDSEEDLANLTASERNADYPYGAGPYEVVGNDYFQD